MRTHLHSWLPVAAALALAAGCRDSGAPRAGWDDDMSGTAPAGDRSGNDATRRDRSEVQGQRDRVMGKDSRATTPVQPASETGQQVQAESKRAEQDEKLMKGTNPAGVVPQKSDESQTRTVVGVLASASDHEVQLKSSDALDLKLRIDPSTSVRIDGQQAKAAQIQPGSEVRASYTSIDGKLTALRLDASSSKGGTAK